MRYRKGMHRWSPLALVLCACASSSAPADSSTSTVMDAPAATTATDGTASCRMVVAVTGMT
ncbi:MAG: hypothetical protein RIF41_30255 [Polyangiaceae bacterium]